MRRIRECIKFFWALHDVYIQCEGCVLLRAVY